MLEHNEVRFPKHEESQSGPVVTYKLSPEELEDVIKKYGPPNRKRNKTRDSRKGGVGDG